MTGYTEKRFMRYLKAAMAEMSLAAGRLQFARYLRQDGDPQYKDFWPEGELLKLVERTFEMIDDAKIVEDDSEWWHRDA